MVERRALIGNQQMIVEGQPDFAVAFPGGDATNDMFNRLTKNWSVSTRFKE